jgi:hypothetical protein
VRSIAELRDKVRAFLQERNPPVLIARGWDHERMAEKRFVTRFDVDDLVLRGPLYSSGYVATWGPSTHMP